MRGQTPGLPGEAHSQYLNVGLGVCFRNPASLASGSSLAPPTPGLRLGRDPGSLPASDLARPPGLSACLGWHLRPGPGRSILIPAWAQLAVLYPCKI